MPVIDASPDRARLPPLVPASSAAALVRVASTLFPPSTVASAACSPLTGRPTSAPTAPAAKTFVCLPCSARSSGVACAGLMLTGMVLAFDLAMLGGVGAGLRVGDDDGLFVQRVFQKQTDRLSPSRAQRRGRIDRAGRKRARSRSGPELQPLHPALGRRTTCSSCRSSRHRPPHAEAARRRSWRRLRRFPKTPLRARI